MTSFTEFMLGVNALVANVVAIAILIATVEIEPQFDWLDTTYPKKMWYRSSYDLWLGQWLLLIQLQQFDDCWKIMSNRRNWVIAVRILVFACWWDSPDRCCPLHSMLDTCDLYDWLLWLFLWQLSMAVAVVALLPWQPAAVDVLGCAWIPWNLSFRYIHCTGQFTLKMKANGEPRLLSSLVWVDQYNECNGMTSFMEFMGITRPP